LRGDSRIAAPYVRAVPELPPRQLAACALALVAVLLLGVWFLSRGGPEAGAAAPPAPIHVQGDGESGGEGGGVVVHVAGAVRDPGVYRLDPGSRVDDAVGRAGGATSRADLSQVNLAAKVEDGRQVLVPKRLSAAEAAAGAAGGTAPAAPAVPLNLNTATLEQLDELDGIGPATAQQILDYREAHGGFGSVEELGQVPGIGEKRLASLREQVRV
jgi:competence protein ComEA